MHIEEEDEFHSENENPVDPNAPKGIENAKKSKVVEFSEEREQEGLADIIKTQNQDLSAIPDERSREGLMTP